MCIFKLKVYDILHHNENIIEQGDKFVYILRKAVTFVLSQCFNTKQMEADKVAYYKIIDEVYKNEYDAQTKIDKKAQWDKNYDFINKASALIDLQADVFNAFQQVFVYALIRF